MNEWDEICSQLLAPPSVGDFRKMESDLRDARTQKQVMLDQWHEMEKQRNAAAERAGRAEARLRTAIETLRQIVEWSSDASYGAGMIDIERAARDGLALITGERQP